MFGNLPGSERYQGAMNQHVVTKLETSDVDYYVLHTRGENPRSVFIASVTEHYKKLKPDQTAEQVNDWLMRLVHDLQSERTYKTLQEFEEVKDTAITAPKTEATVSLESLVYKPGGSRVLGIVKKTGDVDE